MSAPRPGRPLLRVRRIGLAVLGLQLDHLASVEHFTLRPVRPDSRLHQVPPGLGPDCAWRPQPLRLHQEELLLAGPRRVPRLAHGAALLGMAAQRRPALAAGHLGRLGRGDRVPLAVRTGCPLAAGRARGLAGRGGPAPARGQPVDVVDRSPWTSTRDYLAMPFIVLLARDLCNDRRRAWVWIFPLLISGDVAATYIAALGLGALLAGRRWRVRGIILAAIGMVAALLITLVHGNLGSGQGLQAYGYLAALGRHRGHLGVSSLVKGILLHPGGVVAEMWSKHRDIWATVAPSGLLGFGFVWLMPLSVIVVLANNLFRGLPVRRAAVPVAAAIHPAACWAPSPCWPGWPGGTSASPWRSPGWSWRRPSAGRRCGCRGLPASGCGSPPRRPPRWPGSRRRFLIRPR